MAHPPQGRLAVLRCNLRLLVFEIGKIDVNDRYAYAAISRTKLRSVLNNVKGEKIKGVKTIVEGVR